MLSVALFGAAFTHRNFAFGSETLLRGVAKVDVSTLLYPLLENKLYTAFHFNSCALMKRKELTVH